ncbi:MAG: hypothetical protein QW514_10070 [Thermoprotei archaeon]
MTLTEREKAILYLILSDEDDRKLGRRLISELQLSREEWRQLEQDLYTFLAEHDQVAKKGERKRP